MKRRVLERSACLLAAGFLLGGAAPAPHKPQKAQATRAKPASHANPAPQAHPAPQANLAPEAAQAPVAVIDPAVQTEGEIIEDPVIRDMASLDRIAPFEDLAPLWDFVDPELQRDVEAALHQLRLDGDADHQRLAVALIDLTDLDQPRVAAVNGDVMMYAASLPKIAVLLGAFEKIAQGKLVLDGETEGLMRRMIRESSNQASTELMTRVGKEYIARVLLSPRYRLYDPKHNGGLWVGKDYAQAGLWRRDPLHNLSHGATAMQVARFYYLLETGNLVTPEHSLMMKEILAHTALGHKFVASLRKIRPDAQLFRKSGSWGTFHSDSVLVERRGRSYIAVALSNDEQGAHWLERIIVALDGIIFRASS
jgi:beta-lactamase class A